MAAEIDQQFVEYIIKSLVNKPDAVSVQRSVDEKGVLLELTVDPEDLGRVIGKRGATAQSLRTLLRALGTKNEARYNLKIIDNGEPRPSANSASTSAPAPVNDDDSVTSSISDEQIKAEEPNVNEEAAAASEPAETPEEKAEDDVVSKTRKELADLDDLDI